MGLIHELARVPVYGLSASMTARLSRLESERFAERTHLQLTRECLCEMRKHAIMERVRAARKKPPMT